MSEENPPKLTPLPRESREPHEEVTQITVQTGEKQPTPTKETDELSKPPEKAKAVLSMEQLMMVGIKKLPTTLEEIPEYLYRPGTKQHETARLIIMEGVTDNDALREQTGLTLKSIYNVKSAIRKVVEEVSGTHDVNSGKTGDKGKTGTNELMT